MAKGKQSGGGLIVMIGVHIYNIVVGWLGLGGGGWLGHIH